jgi:hypothetical protein
MPMEDKQSSIKKCPSCGEWSGWNLSIDDTCDFCGALLDPKAVEARDRREEREAVDKPIIKLIPIYPDDHPVLKFLKTIARGAQLVFMALISFFIWLIAVVGS